MVSLAQAFKQWKELAADIPPDDAPMLAESWNNYTDSLCKDGELCGLQYHYAPAYDDDMPGDGSRFDPLADDRAFILDAMGVTLSAVFVPLSQSRNKADTRPSLNWRVTLRKDGRDVTETDYMQGPGRCPAYRQPSTFPNGHRDEWMTRQRIAAECETGRATANVSRGGNFVPRAGKRIDPPAVVDVLHCLLTDASAIDCRDFADWCDETGGDSDSIAARDAYNACVATGLKLRAAFGEKRITELRELFADY